MKIQVINTKISIGTKKQLLDAIINDFIVTKSTYICFANVHSLMLAYKDREFNQILNDADWVAPDGRSVSMYLKLFKKIDQERVAGMDMFPELIQFASDRDLSVYFYGATEHTLSKIKHRLENEYPDLRIAGMQSPPFRELTDLEMKTSISKINASKPDLVLVSLGCPKQEFWMSNYKNELNACMIGLGQAFKTFSGEEKRLPKVLRNLKWLPLEWLYRLVLEPRRLWKRFFWSNSLFIWVVTKKILRKVLTVN